MDKCRPAASWSAERITALAERQHGVVTRAQILATGATDRMVERRVRADQLLRKHRGVYLLGHLKGRLEPKRAREMAAILATGSDGVISHRTAARLWKMLPAARSDPPIDVTVRRRRHPHRAGIRGYRSLTLAAGEVTRVQGIPVTTPLRTVLDLAAVAGHRELARAAASAERLGLLTASELSTLPALQRGRPGGPALQAALGGSAALTFTRSEAEECLLALVNRGQLPPPKVNCRLLDYEVDFFWSKERLVVEVDGFKYHNTRRSFENDRRRDAALTAAGYRVIRLTWRQITEEADVTLVRLAQALVRSSGS